MNKILSLTRRCVEDYEMIQPGDRIAVGVSGGKDSLLLLHAMDISLVSTSEHDLLRAVVSARLNKDA